MRKFCETITETVSKQIRTNSLTFFSFTLFGHFNFQRETNFTDRIPHLFSPKYVLLDILFTMYIVLHMWQNVVFQCNIFVVIQDLEYAPLVCSAVVLCFLLEYKMMKILECNVCYMLQLTFYYSSPSSQRVPIQIQM